jgi:hypothetical protein
MCTYSTIAKRGKTSRSFRWIMDLNITLKQSCCIRLNTDCFVKKTFGEILVKYLSHMINLDIDLTSVPTVQTDYKTKKNEIKICKLAF